MLATVLVAGNMIGSGVYLLPATLATVGSISILGWVICTVGALLLAGGVRRAGVVRPTTNGLVAYAEEALGPYFGFQTGLIYWLSILIGVIAIAVAFTGYLSSFFPALKAPLVGAACTVAVIWLLTVVNIIGPRLMGKVGMLTLVLGLLPILGVAFLGWFCFDPGGLHRVLERLGQARRRSPSRGCWSRSSGRSPGWRAPPSPPPWSARPERNVPIAAIGGVALSAAGLHPGHRGDQRHPAGRRPGQVLRALRRRRHQGRWAPRPPPWSPSAPCSRPRARSAAGCCARRRRRAPSADLGFFPRAMARVRSNGAPAVALVVHGRADDGDHLPHRQQDLNAQFTVLINMSVLMTPGRLHLRLRRPGPLRHAARR